eukprot:1185949-Prorocentrum_minimum.AAC.2
MGSQLVKHFVLIRIAALSQTIQVIVSQSTDPASALPKFEKPLTSSALSSDARPSLRKRPAGKHPGQNQNSAPRVYQPGFTNKICLTGIDWKIVFTYKPKRMLTNRFTCTKTNLNLHQTPALQR